MPRGERPLWFAVSEQLRKRFDARPALHVKDHVLQETYVHTYTLLVRSAFFITKSTNINLVLCIAEYPLASVRQSTSWSFCVILFSKPAFRQLSHLACVCPTITCGFSATHVGQKNNTYDDGGEKSMPWKGCIIGKARAAT